MEILSNIGLYHYLILSLLLFIIGIFGVCICKNTIKMFLYWQMILGAIGINFVSFATYIDSNNLQGYTFQIFIIILSLLQIVLMGILLLSLYKNNKKLTRSEK